MSLGEFASGHIHCKGEYGAPVIPSPQNVSTGVKGHGMNFARHFAASPLQAMFIYNEEQVRCTEVSDSFIKDTTPIQNNLHEYSLQTWLILCTTEAGLNDSFSFLHH